MAGSWLWIAAACYLAGLVWGSVSIIRGRRQSGSAINGFIAAGYLTSGPAEVTNGAFLRTTDGGATWEPVPDVTSVRGFAFGKHAPGETYPAIYVNGYHNGTYGFWRSNDGGDTWGFLGNTIGGSLDFTRQVEADKNVYGRFYVVTGGSGVLQADVA